MTAYCLFSEFRQRMSGDQPVLSGAYDETIVGIIADVSAMLDEEVRNVRGQQAGWSFLPPSLYGSSLVAVSGFPISGTFTLTFGASTTSALLPTAAAADVQAALDVILGAGQSVVTGAPGGPWTVTYAGTLSGSQPVLKPADTFAPAGAHPDVAHVVMHAEGGYTANLPIADVSGDDALVAYAFGDEPLEPAHGYPLRSLVPHLYLWKSVKWLRGIELVTEDRPGFWERNGYHDRGDPWLEQRHQGD